jgi:tetratricopeptide (TPR) repeat protein
MVAPMAAAWTRAVISAHLRSVRTIVWAAILALAAVVMAFIPLFDVLGFEFAFALALVTAPAAGDLACAYVRRARAAQRPPLERAVGPVAMLGGLLGRAALGNLAVLAPPLLIISLNALRVRNCDWWFGLECYLLLAIPSALAGTVVGVLSALIAGPRRRLAIALPYLVVVASLLLAVWRFYAAPPVFSYNLFGGYYPGNLYDEEIGFAAPFLWSRLFQLSLLAALLAAAALCLDVPELRLSLRSARPERRRLPPALVLAGAGMLAAALWARSGRLGFDVTADDIKAQLGGRYETEHFVIWYPRGGVIERDIALIGEDHEFRLAQVERTLGVHRPGKITSFYFADADQKFRLMGARNVYMAKPWRGEIYVHHMPFPHGVLRHEITHVVAAEFGDPLFGVSVRSRFYLPFFNVGLIEGTAVAVDWPDHRAGGMTPHQSVKAMRELGIDPPLEEILSLGFLSFSAARSYTVAGSFVRFLLDRWGADRLRVLYHTGGDFMTAYGREFDQIAAEWRAMIDQVELPPGAVEVLREAFRRPSIFSRPCAHAIAGRRARAAELLASGRVDEAAEQLRSVCDQAPEEPSYRMDLARVLLLGDDRADAEAILTEIAGDSEGISSPVRAQALLELAGAQVRAGQSDEARALLEQAAALPLDEDSRRLIVAQRTALDHTGPAGPTLRDYFFGQPAYRWADPFSGLGRAAAAAAAEPSLGLAQYLLGRNLSDHGMPRETVAALQRALDAGLPDPLFVREAAHMLAEAAYRAGDEAALRRAVDILSAADQPETTRLYGREWLERWHWKQTGALLP